MFETTDGLGAMTVIHMVHGLDPFYKPICLPSSILNQDIIQLSYPGKPACKVFDRLPMV